MGGGGEDTQGQGGMAGVGCIGARRAKIKLEKPTQGHQSQPGTQTWGLSPQGHHHSIGQFPAWGLDEEPITECAVNAFDSSSLSWNFVALLKLPTLHDEAVALHWGVVAVKRFLPSCLQAVQAKVG